MTGSIIMYGKAQVPSGFLLCDGSAVSRTTYADLFALISTTYGAGDGSTTFNIPDLRGRSVVGRDAGGDTDFDNLGDTGGAKTVSLAHSHTMTLHSHSSGSGTASATGSGFTTLDGSPADTSTAVYAHTHTLGTATIGNASNQGTSTDLSATQSIMPKFLVLYPIIET